MRRSLRFFLLLPALGCFLLGTSFTASAGGDDWRAVDPSELTLKTSTVEKDADAEALFDPIEKANDHTITLKQAAH